MPPLSPVQAPELVFGLIAPIGVDLTLVSDVLGQTLREMHYEAHSFRITELMREVPIRLSLVEGSYVSNYKQRIAYANAVRQELGNEALAALAISAIRTYRATERHRLINQNAQDVRREGGKDADARDEEAPLANQAYIIRQLKRPEEVLLLRSVYGRQFILVSAFAPEEWRLKRIEQQERASRGGLISGTEAHHAAHELIAQDAKETQEAHGQSVRDAFPLGDVFIDATSRQKCETSLRRFIHLLFGNNEITPSHDEYGMYMAKSASLRSSDLSRQVGAAIFLTSGEIATLGCNEVPKAGGGTYWAGDETDRRDFVEGHDPNERNKTEVLVDVLDRLKRGGYLSKELQLIENTVEAAQILLKQKGPHSVSESRIMDLIEFGRIIHAEMSAICDASRIGISVKGGTLYCTTFPCHLCAKHIVAAGLGEVTYLEPYPKSYATSLHSDSISLDINDTGKKVNFRAFVGVSPFRYRDLFEKGRRKYSHGGAQQWQGDPKRPMIEVYHPQYFKSEGLVVSALGDRLEMIESESPSSETDCAS